MSLADVGESLKELSDLKKHAVRLARRRRRRGAGSEEWSWIKDRQGHALLADHLVVHAQPSREERSGAPLLPEERKPGGIESPNAVAEQEAGLQAECLRVVGAVFKKPARQQSSRGVSPGSLPRVFQD